MKENSTEIKISQSIYLIFSSFTDTIDIQHSVSVKCTTCWFNTFICCPMFTFIVKLTPPTHYHIITISFFVMRTFKIHFPSNFEVYNTILLTIVITLHVRYPKRIGLVTGSLCPLTNKSSSLPAFTCPQFLITTNCTLFFWIQLF